MATSSTNASSRQVQYGACEPRLPFLLSEGREARAGDFGVAGGILLGLLCWCVVAAEDLRLGRLGLR